MIDAPVMISVKMRCQNVDSDGTQMYANRRTGEVVEIGTPNSIPLITEEKKRVPSRKFCPDDIWEGRRNIKYAEAAPSLEPKRCSCHGLMRLEYRRTRKGDMDTKDLKEDEREAGDVIEKWAPSGERWILLRLTMLSMLSRLCECRKQLEQDQREFAAEQLAELKGKVRSYFFHNELWSAQDVENWLTARAAELRAKE